MKSLPMIQPHQPAGSAIDPVCGMTVDPTHAAGSYEHAGKTYYFCNVSCLNRFKADPARYMKPAQATGSQKDPVCGMDVVPDHAAGAVEHKERTYYFCSDHCVKKFKEDPERYVDRPSPAASHVTPHDHTHTAHSEDMEYT
ncbi:MAG TPA: YHS domain-containing protein, partial [Nitrospiraceae bacterium]|nr:YHS domain-containing protein [Nitrospiraceae bacterium]